MYLFKEAFSAVVIIVATRSERSNCPSQRCHDASRRGNTHAQQELQPALSRFCSVFSDPAKLKYRVVEMVFSSNR